VLLFNPVISTYEGGREQGKTEGRYDILASIRLSSNSSRQQSVVSRSSERKTYWGEGLLVREGGALSFRRDVKGIVLLEGGKKRDL